ncbi:hypothetical protein ACWKWU_16190 [Chitinophaga lutea]
MKDETNKALSIIDSLKLQPPDEEARLQQQKSRDCPTCGARTAKQPGLTHCAYCGHEFSGKEGS